MFSSTAFGAAKGGPGADAAEVPEVSSASAAPINASENRTSKSKRKSPAINTSCGCEATGSKARLTKIQSDRVCRGGEQPALNLLMARVVPFRMQPQTGCGFQPAGPMLLWM